MMPPNDGENLGIPLLNLGKVGSDRVHVHGVGGDADDVGIRTLKDHLQVLFQPQIENFHVVMLTHARSQVLESQRLVQE
jgi:hypothetical protein